MRRPLARRDAFALAAVCLIGVGVPLWLAASAGAIGIPTIDDWVYMRGADSLFRTGSVDMPSHTAASIGQLVMVQPLLWLSGGNDWAYTAFGLIMTLVGVVTTYFLARRFVATGPAVLVVLLVLAFPGFARESASFMTDVPAYALAMLCLLLGTIWLEGGRRLALVAWLGAGLLAVSVREFALAAPVAVLVVGWSRSRASTAWLAAASAILVAGVATVLIVAVSIPGRADPTTPSVRGLFLVGPVFVTLAAVVLPALALSIGRRLTSFSPAQVLLGAGLASLGGLIPWGLAGGNGWMQNGLAGDLLLSGTRHEVIASGAWALSRQAAVFAAVVLAMVAARWGQQNVQKVHSVSGAIALAARIARSRDGLLLLFLGAYVAELGAFSLIWIYDRYLFPLVPVVALLVLRRSAEPVRIGRSLAFAHAAMAWLAVSAFVIAANSFAYDAARWRAGEVAAAMGYEARTVDAGYEWVGYHASLIGPLSAPATNMIWRDSRWALRDPCAVLSNSPLDLPGLRLVTVNRAAYLRYLFFGSAEPLYLYSAQSAGCPPPPTAAANATAP